MAAAVVVLMLAAGAPPHFSPPTNFSAGDGPVSVVVGDLNGDSRPDLATANAISNNLSVLLNTAAL